MYQGKSVLENIREKSENWWNISTYFWKLVQSLCSFHSNRFFFIFVPYFYQNSMKSSWWCCSFLTFCIYVIITFTEDGGCIWNVTFSHKNVRAKYNFVREKSGNFDICQSCSNPDVVIFLIVWPDSQRVYVTFPSYPLENITCITKLIKMFHLRDSVWGCTYQFSLNHWH